MHERRIRYSSDDRRMSMLYGNKEIFLAIKVSMKFAMAWKVPVVGP